MITDAVIDPSSKGNIETFVVKDNAPIAFYIINSDIDHNNIYIENYYYRTISNRTAKVRCRDFKYNSNTGIRIVPNKLYGKLKATDKINDCLFIYDIKYRLHTNAGEEDRLMRFAFKIVPEDEYIMYQNIEVKPVIDDGNEIKRPKKVDS